ncbi:MAG: hypothetical protein MO853_07930 [Candidatus Protistobacter heckmanni]|nr:hypothetical protein [Candidatus Protistobacter heckmanni]
MTLAAGAFTARLEAFLGVAFLDFSLFATVSDVLAWEKTGRERTNPAAISRIVFRPGKFDRISRI